MKDIKADKPARRRIFNLDQFTKETKEAEYTYPQLEDVKELAQFKSDELLKMVNLALKRNALLEAKSQIKGASTAIVSKLLAGFKLLPQFKNIDGRANQDMAIIEMLKGSPALFEMIKQQVEQASNEPEEEDGDED